MRKLRHRARRAGERHRRARKRPGRRASERAAVAATAAPHSSACRPAGATAGRKREINIARRSARAWERGDRTAGSGELELELDGSPARKIHIFKYFSHGPQSPRHAALPPTACYPLRTYYLPDTWLGIAAGAPRVSTFLATHCRSLSFSLFFALARTHTHARTYAYCFSLSLLFPCDCFSVLRRTTHASFLLAGLCVSLACIAVSRGSTTSTGELLLVETLRLRREM